MKNTITILIISFFLTDLTGCAAPKMTGFRADPRAGSVVSPYRTIPAEIQCDDCRMTIDQ